MARSNAFRVISLSVACSRLPPTGPVPTVFAPHFHRTIQCQQRNYIGEGASSDDDYSCSLLFQNTVEYFAYTGIRNCVVRVDLEWRERAIIIQQQCTLIRVAQFMKKESILTPLRSIFMSDYLCVVQKRRERLPRILVFRFKPANGLPPILSGNWPPSDKHYAPPQSDTCAPYVCGAPLDPFQCHSEWNQQIAPYHRD